jgi:RNA polymerase sigma factor (sigma-70 family)
MKAPFGTSLQETRIRLALQTDSREFLRFLQSLVHSGPDAEDLFQSGSIRAIEKSANLENPDKVRPWLLSLFRNLALDFLRSRQRQERLFQGGDEAFADNLVDSAPEPSSVCACGKKLLGEIPVQYASLLKDVEIDEVSLKDVAKKLKTTENNVSVRLHRARNSLKQAVKNHCQVETLSECLDCGC